MNETRNRATRTDAKLRKALTVAFSLGVGVLGANVAIVMMNPEPAMASPYWDQWVFFAKLLAGILLLSLVLLITWPIMAPGGEYDD